MKIKFFLNICIHAFILDVINRLTALQIVFYKKYFLNLHTFKFYAYNVMAVLSCSIKNCME